MVEHARNKKAGRLCAAASPNWGQPAPRWV